MTKWGRWLLVIGLGVGAGVAMQSCGKKSKGATVSLQMSKVG